MASLTSAVSSLSVSFKPFFKSSSSDEEIDMSDKTCAFCGEGGNWQQIKAQEKANFSGPKRLTDAYPYCGKIEKDSAEEKTDTDAKVEWVFAHYGCVLFCKSWDLYDLGKRIKIEEVYVVRGSNRPLEPKQYIPSGQESFGQLTYHSKYQSIMQVFQHFQERHGYNPNMRHAKQKIQRGEISTMPELFHYVETQLNY